MLLKYDIDTTPGVTSYESNKEEMATMFVFSVIAEGYREEPKYLNAIKTICTDIDNLNVVIYIINRQYQRQVDSAGHSSPLKRLEALLEWKEKHPSIEGYENKDEYWLICDRDDGSFTDTKFDEAVTLCQQNGINFIISNPAFQLWLLLHFTDNLAQFRLEQYSTSNECLDKGVIPAIKMFVPHYSHGNLVFKHFKEHLHDALVNCKPYSHEVQVLKSTIGTNFNLLLERLEEVVGSPIF